MNFVTLKEVAAKANVSYQTVSKIINGNDSFAPETEERVWEAVRELNYQPNVSARNLRRQSTNKIGLVYNSGISYISDYFSEIIVGATTTAQQSDRYVVLYINDWDSPDKLLKLFKAREVDGLMLVLDHVPADMIEKLLDKKLPFVVLGRRVNHPLASYIAPDNYNGALALMNHFLNLGHSRIAFTANPVLKLTHEDRFAAYVDSLEKANIPFDPALVVEARIDHSFNENGINQLLDLPNPPTAIFAFHDIFATDILRIILNRGLRVPQDIALAGFDGLNASMHTTPAITTVKQPLREMGSQTVNALLELIENNHKPPIRLTLPVELAVRESTIGIKSANYKK